MKIHSMMRGDGMASFHWRLNYPPLAEREGAGRAHSASNIEAIAPHSWQHQTTVFSNSRQTS